MQVSGDRFFNPMWRCFFYCSEIDTDCSCSYRTPWQNDYAWVWLEQEFLFNYILWFEMSWICVFPPTKSRKHKGLFMYLLLHETQKQSPWDRDITCHHHSSKFSEAQIFLCSCSFSLCTLLSSFQILLLSKSLMKHFQRLSLRYCPQPMLFHPVLFFHSKIPQKYLGASW